MTRNGKFLMRTDLADRVLPSKRASGDGRAEDADLGRGAHVRLVEERALLDVPGAHERPLDADALDLRAPVQVAGDDLRAAARRAGET